MLLGKQQKILLTQEITLFQILELITILKQQKAVLLRLNKLLEVLYMLILKVRKTHITQEIISFQILELIMILKMFHMLLNFQKRNQIINFKLHGKQKKIQLIQEIILFQILELIEILNGQRDLLNNLRKLFLTNGIQLKTVIIGKICQLLMLIHHMFFLIHLQNTQLLQRFQVILLKYPLQLIKLTFNQNQTQFALVLDVLNINNQKLDQGIQWTISFQILELIKISKLHSLVLRLLKKLLVTNGIGKENQNQKVIQVTKYLILELMKKSNTLKMELNGLKLNLITNGNQNKMLMDSGVSQKLLTTIHTSINESHSTKKFNI